MCERAFDSEFPFHGWSVWQYTNEQFDRGLVADVRQGEAGVVDVGSIAQIEMRNLPLFLY